MKKIVCMALAASMILSGVAGASAQPWQGQDYHRGEGRPAPQYQPQPAGWHGGYERGGDEHRGYEHGGWEHRGWERPVPVPAPYVAYAPAYEPEYAPAYAPAYAPGYPVVEEDNGANVVGAVMVGAIAAGILATVLAHPGR